MTDHIPDAMEKLIEAVALDAIAEALCNQMHQLMPNLCPSWADSTEEKRRNWRRRAYGTAKAIDAAGWQIVPKVINHELPVWQPGDDSQSYWTKCLAAAPKVVP